jgi:hypothetical protein
MLAYAGLTCRWLLVGVFVVAAASKATRHAFQQFTASTGRLLPARWSGRGRPVAVAVLAGEAATAGLLAWPVTAPAGLGLAVVLSLGFAAGIGGALRRREQAHCHCFGASTTPLGRTHLARNGAMAGVALAGLALPQLSPGPVHPVGAGLAVLVGLLLAALVVRMDDLVALFAPMST